MLRKIISKKTNIKTFEGNISQAVYCLIKCKLNIKKTQQTIQIKKNRFYRKFFKNIVLIRNFPKIYFL